MRMFLASLAAMSVLAVLTAGCEKAAAPASQDEVVLNVPGMT